jgi:putative holliday junction resolvase
LISVTPSGIAVFYASWFERKLPVRVLGLDIGSKRIGVAVSDELGLTAQGLETLICKNPDEDLGKIARLAEEYHVMEIVVGMPYNMNGTEGPQAQKVRALMQRIGEETHRPVQEWDERLSTAAADRALLEADMSRSKRRKVIDKIAAVIILQGYLDRQRYAEAR